MTHSSGASRLTRARIAAALSLAVLLVVGSATGLLWHRLAAATGAQLDMDRDLVALDGVMLRLAHADTAGESAADLHAEAVALVSSLRGGAGGAGVRPELDRLAAATGTSTPGAVDVVGYLQARTAVESNVIAVVSDAEGKRVTLLATGAGIGAALATALAGVVLADRRRRRRSERPAVAPVVATGAYDTDALQRDLEVAARRAIDTGATLAAVLVEVDHYTIYAQTQGAAAGEVLLEAVTAIVRDAVRASDSSYRCDETTFVLLLPDTDCLAAVRLAERLRESIVRALLSEGTTVSAGVAEIPSGARDAADLLAAAGAALADATRQGRNQVRRSSVPADEAAAAHENVGRH